MGLFGGEKKKRVPNSLKKKGAVAAKKENVAPAPEQAKPVVKKPVIPKAPAAQKAATAPISVLDRAKAFNNGTAAKKDDKPNVSVPIGSVSERAKAFGDNNDKVTKEATTKTTTKASDKKKFGLFGGKEKDPKEAKPKEKPKVAEKSKPPKSPGKNKKKISLFAKSKENTESIPEKNSSQKNSNADDAPTKPGKLSMAALSIKIPGLGGGPRGTDLETKSAPGKAPPQIDIYADSEISPDNQGHSGMSDEARNKLVAPKETKLGKSDWKFLYELAQQYDAYKAQEAEVSKKKTSTNSRQKSTLSNSEPADIKNNLNNIFGGGPGGVASNYDANGSFLNNKYFDQFLVEHSSGTALEFSNETGLYKRFCRKDQEQRTISLKFAAALTKHPKAKKITMLNMSSALIPDSFLVALCDQCRGLPNLQVLNLESNDLGREGIEALSKCIASPKGFNRLQILKLENQKKDISAAAEEILGDAIVQSQSLVQVGLVIKGGVPKQQVSNTVQANLDKLRVARREHASKKGKLKARKRNEMETLFDTIAANKDKNLTEVDLTENLRFLGLDAVEITKSGAAFASNKYVKKVTMTKLKLDDDFAEAFGKALVKNKTLETVVLDSNSFSAKGIRALLSGLGQNKSVTNFQIRHQSKTMASSDEEGLLELLKKNTTLVNLGTDVRNPLVKSQLERKMNENRDLQRKQRNAQKKK